jgi:hypothetical protein
LMAMAVAPDDTAAARLQKLGPQSDIDVPHAPVWVTLSSGALRSNHSLPDETRLFATAVTDANRISLTAEPAGSEFEVRLDAICRDAQQAGALTMQLQMLTNMLRDGSKKSTSPDPGGLADLLMNGTFQQTGSHVFGRWPIHKQFLKNIAAP